MTRTRVVVAHEWLTNWAGSERVAAQLVAATRPRELVTAVLDPALARERFGGLPVRGLWPSRLPGSRAHWTRYAPALLAAWAGTRIEADVLLVSAHFAAHAATVRFPGRSIVYYHTPARILWRTDLELARVPAELRAVVRDVVLPPLRRWDRWVARHPTELLANSTAVAERLETAYGRSARVVHPPVDVAAWSTVERTGREHLLWVGRLVAYKRPDLAVEAARRTGLPLVVVGDGPERARLERTAPANVRFLGHASRGVVRAAVGAARVLLAPGEEDFGIAPVEALAAGVPVVSPALGGATDYLRDGQNAVLVPDQDPERFTAAVRTAWSAGFDPAAVRLGAAGFGPERFRAEIAAVLAGPVGTPA